ncbi:MAG: hypothetical protein KR126chlam2_01123, partial [Chlamydiae bacterium]|nr:hypothetical protein [Chlamydiota bacterium]
VHVGDVDLIQALVQAHKDDLDWENALKNTIIAFLPKGKRIEILTKILTNTYATDLTKAFKTGKELKVIMLSVLPKEIPIFIPHIGDLRQGFVDALHPVQVDAYIRLALQRDFEGMEMIRLKNKSDSEKKQILIKMLGARYVIAHWNQLDEAGKQKYLSGKLLTEAQTGGKAGLKAYFNGMLLMDEIKE